LQERVRRLRTYNYENKELQYNKKFFPWLHSPAQALASSTKSG
jgi:hypothetical protein